MLNKPSGLFGGQRMTDRQDLNMALQRLAQRYAEVAQESLGDQLTAIALFGSVARGKAGPASDIDLFVVFKEAPRGVLRRRALLEPARQQLAADLEPLWEQGIYTDFVEIIRSEAEARLFHPLYLDMTVEAELLYDREGFLRDALQRLRRRLEVLGAERRSLGHTYYWDLKPQLAPGEVIEL
jgi:predicted nucleotidyltransferase